MAVVAAGVHFAGDGGDVGEGVGFGDVEGVHVGTQTDARAGLCAVQYADDASYRKPGMHFVHAKGMQ